MFADWYISVHLSAFSALAFLAMGSFIAVLYLNQARVALTEKHKKALKQLAFTQRLVRLHTNKVSKNTRPTLLRPVRTNGHLYMSDSGMDTYIYHNLVAENRTDRHVRLVFPKDAVVTSSFFRELLSTTAMRFGLDTAAFVHAKYTFVHLDPKEQGFLDRTLESVLHYSERKHAGI